MARYARPHLPGTAQHLIARFVNEEFRLTDGERPEYLRRAARALSHTDRTALGYALMSSHVHWATLAGRDKPGDFVLPYHSGFARWLNRHQDRKGPVFMDRFRLVVFEGETLAALLAYVHNNPVRAGVVPDPIDSTWTSHAAYVGERPAPPWLNVKRGLSLCGFDASPSGRLAFHQFVCSRAGLPRDANLSGGNLPKKRAEVRAMTNTAVELGATHVSSRGWTVDLVARAGALVARRWTGSVEELLPQVEQVTGVRPDLVRSTSRTRRIVEARRVALLAWTQFLGCRQAALAAALGISSSAASQLMDPERLSPSTLTSAAEVAERVVFNRQGVRR